MFSGIVDHCGKLVSAPSHQTQFWVTSQFNDLILGESIAVDGMCLTVVDLRDGQFACELSPETLRITIAAHYQIGQALNLERAMRLNDRLSGHFVTGHIDETLSVGNINVYDEFIEVQFSDVSSKNQRYLLQKGSVAINGVSLTVNQVDRNGFSIMLIPHTLERTHLSDLKVGQRVNVEWDYLAKLIGQQMQQASCDEEAIHESI